MSKLAIFWDNDGVLVDTERLYFEATREVFESRGVGLDEATFREHFMNDSSGAWHLLGALPPGEIAALRATRNHLYSELLSFEDFVIEGVEETLGRLAGRITMGVVTGSRRTHFERMHARTGFGRFFDFVITADDVTRTKPDPEAYLRAVARIGRDHEDCVVVEDSQRGLRAAKAARLECWVVPSTLTERADLDGADHHLDDVRDIPALLALD